MKPFPSIRDLKLENRPVFMRLDLNVPLSNGEITSDARIQAALPTIQHALKEGARLALASHLGRPKGKRRAEDSLEPVGSAPDRGEKVSLVIPAMNEATNIAWVLRQVPACVDEVILVDGHSRDATVMLAQTVRPDIHVIEHVTDIVDLGNAAAKR